MRVASPRLGLPLKWHGGKYYLAPQIVALIPPHLHYVEPFAGGLAVLLARDPDDRSLWVGTAGREAGVSEVVNDISGELTNFWRVLRDEDLFGRFSRRVTMTPLSRAEFDGAAGWQSRGDSVEDAWAFFVRCRQSLSGRMKGFTGLTRTRTRRRMNGNASEWLGAVDGLTAVHERLRRVVIENADALDLIRREDTPGTLFYLDPPYLGETRASADVYSHEMTRADHQRLLDLIRGVRGKVMLSGYPSDLYDGALAGWTRHRFDLPNNAAGGGTKRRMEEVLWCNF
jgi:DNA adenine methylase